MAVQGNGRSGNEAVKSACLLPDVERPGGSVLWARRRTWLYESGATAAKCWLLGETGYIPPPTTRAPVPGGYVRSRGVCFFLSWGTKIPQIDPRPTKGGGFPPGVPISPKNNQKGRPSAGPPHPCPRVLSTHAPCSLHALWPSLTQPPLLVNFAQRSPTPDSLNSLPAARTAWTVDQLYANPVPCPCRSRCPRSNSPPYGQSKATPMLQELVLNG